MLNSKNKGAVQSRKQRKARYSAVLHQQQKFMHVHLSPELRKKHGVRNTQLKKGDKVKVLRGQFKGKEAVVDKVELKREKVYLQGIELIKKDGNKIMVPLSPSNLMITSLVLNDKKRKAKLTKMQVPAAEKKQETKIKEAPVKTENKN